jgi:sugar phosphate isomerase/epimerase
MFRARNTKSATLMCAQFCAGGMNHMAALIACQTYTWEMLGASWQGSADDILDAVSAAGYAGVEFSNAMIGAYWDAPDRLATALSQRRLRLAAFAYASGGFTDPQRYDADLAGTAKALAFCRTMGVPLCLGGAAASSRSEYERQMGQAIRFYRVVAERGLAAGVTVCVHPHSHHGSLLESAEEYDALLEGTAEVNLMFNPDAGHIARGGQDVMSCFRRYRSRIAHVHIKDVDARGNWQPLGAGIIPWRELLGFLSETNYAGWVVAEEESAAAYADPVGAVHGNRTYLRSLGA